MILRVLTRGREDEGPLARPQLERMLQLARVVGLLGRRHREHHVREGRTAQGICTAGAACTSQASLWSSALEFCQSGRLRLSSNSKKEKVAWVAVSMKVLVSHTPCLCARVLGSMPALRSTSWREAVAVSATTCSQRHQTENQRQPKLPQALF